MKRYTLPELVNKTDREFFTAEEICGVLEINPNTLRLTARQRPEPSRPRACAVCGESKGYISPCPPLPPATRCSCA